jgi:hypothetical protein
MCMNCAIKIGIQLEGAKESFTCLLRVLGDILNIGEKILSVPTTLKKLSSNPLYKKQCS